MLQAISGAVAGSWRRNNPGKAIIIVLDNLKSHKVEEVKVEAEKLGIELVFLPPYSPDLNPIEYVWKSIKRIISTTLRGFLLAYEKV